MCNFLWLRSRLIQAQIVLVNRDNRSRQFRLLDFRRDGDEESVRKNIGDAQYKLHKYVSQLKSRQADDKRQQYQAGREARNDIVSKTRSAFYTKKVRLFLIDANYVYLTKKIICDMKLFIVTNMLFDLKNNI